MKLFIYVVCIFFVGGNVYASGLNVLNECKVTEEYGKTVIYENCIGGNVFTVDIHNSGKGVPELVKIIKKGSYDISLLKDKMNDELVSAVYSLILIEKELVYFFATENTVTVLLKDNGIVIFKKSDSVWRQISIGES
ncbi:hypothetical protein [Pseudoalteromonas luteoviolacea]|uniref:hypothetical protein n=1 Tax=Pseudoalteromonas luteoviolacea TaxID=43657 RepID=UPI0011538D58|nr:hypothetical protein [Pseudoalteromonas luteoviolacea]TQF72057.1 hypothetical protein FLM44_13810 [Pseudoalteromonas luteoviolacea]